MEIAVHILSWNGEKYLPDLLASLEAQTAKNLLIRVLDNGSTDGSVKFLREHYSQYLVARNTKNLGFAPGHNQLFNFTFDKWSGQDLTKKAILLVNQDMILEPKMIEELVRVLETEPEAAALQPKIYRLFPPSGEDEGIGQPIKSDILDTTGLEKLPGWRFRDRGAGEMDTHQYDKEMELFGATGTLVMYRASALAEVAEGGEIFDNDYFAYKEDCDLAWRLKRANLKSFFVPSAIAWHYRGAYGAAKRSLKRLILDRRGRRPFIAALSTRNQLLMLVKNLTFKEAIVSGPRIIFEEGVRLIYALIFERETRRMMLASPKFFWRAYKKRSRHKVSGA